MTPIRKSQSQPILQYSHLPSSSTTTTMTPSPTKRFDFHLLMTETMRRLRAPTTLCFVFLSLLLFASFSLFLSRNALSDTDFQFLPVNIRTRSIDPDPISNAVHEEVNDQHSHASNVSSIQDSLIDSVSILLPEWEVLVLVSTPLAGDPTADDYTCLYPTNDTSQASFLGVMPFHNQTAFRCLLPDNRLRHRLPFPQPVLTRSKDKDMPPLNIPAPELIRCKCLVYESFSTEDDVVLFVKGINVRQGINKSPSELRCVFGDYTKNNSVRTAVTSSAQEVFRCHHPNLTAVSSGAEGERIKISLEITQNNRVVPSVAYYAPWRKLENPKPKSLICATTMVYNVAKYLREWVMYHSKIGVERFILYDNGSDDDLKSVVNELNEEGYDVETLLWVWPKTQEAGFSHVAVYAKDSCTWMAYVDVDEFIFSPSWLNLSQPSNQLLKSLLQGRKSVGQVSIKCNDFGPSNQVSHPIEGVTQGYDCRLKTEQRHKSIVLLEAIDFSLLNVVHHFNINVSYYKKRDLGLDDAVINHYKYQAWSEFKTKFRRRVSTYVVDWKQSVNPKSKDRTPGLGFEEVEPKGWPNKFCEVHDDRLKLLTQRWFGMQTPDGDKMAWQQI
ncbi:Glyco_transf_92 domain-containing protein [Cephalotus follicularis]|uniref:Glycosyltransferase family 92 protein n=1 Tax=Cephalotus follicularis TaxID=3775 RepID=A0A1Q3D6Q6_CEPFO|nr:Glyco_transf_92 domain-containing protein [Cephalotus follicularis]